MNQAERQIPILDLSAEIEALWDDRNTAIQQGPRSGRFILGPEVEAFECEVAGYRGVKHALGVNPGTDMLVIGLRALGIGPGDEVITPPPSSPPPRRSARWGRRRFFFVEIDPEPSTLSQA